MQVLQYKQDAFGQNMLVGLNYDLLWLPVAAAIAIIVLHLIIRRVRRTG